MGQPVKLSDQLVSDARSSADLMQRSIAGQIEYWAGIGKAMDSMMRPDNVVALNNNVTMAAVVARLAEVDTHEGRDKVKVALAQKPFPHYEREAGNSGRLVRIDADGTKTPGRLIGRLFVPA